MYMALNETNDTMINQFNPDGSFAKSTRNSFHTGCALTSITGKQFIKACAHNINTIAGITNNEAG
jgi:hypothetical protein